MTFFKKLKKKHPNLYIVIAAASVVMFWRGVWGLLDIYLFPGNEVASHIASLLVGLTLLFINDFKLSELKDM